MAANFGLGSQGLSQVKRSVENLLGLIRTNAELEEQEKPLKTITLNRVFLGNPGTGKTTVANIYGRILRDLGLLSKADVVVKIPGDFIGSVLGESEKKTAALLDASLGCVLVIDEAYGLHSGNKTKDPYRVCLHLSSSSSLRYKANAVTTCYGYFYGLPVHSRVYLVLFSHQSQ